LTCIRGAEADANRGRHAQFQDWASVSARGDVSKSSQPWLNSVAHQEGCERNWDGRGKGNGHVCWPVPNDRKFVEGLGSDQAGSCYGHQPANKQPVPPLQSNAPALVFGAPCDKWN
jgi:hypothetical protein